MIKSIIDSASVQVKQMPVLLQVILAILMAAVSLLCFAEAGLALMRVVS